MRINVYSEEITDEFIIIRKPEGGYGTGRLFIGIRFFLKSPDSLHHTPENDDRSAVTFWVPWNQKTENEDGKVFMSRLFHKVSNAIALFKDFA